MNIACAGADMADPAMADPAIKASVFIVDKGLL
jgi:hypothetical protein